MTIIRTLPFAYAGAGALPPLALTQFEIDLAANPNCLSWWRADVGFLGTWADRKAGRLLTPKLTNTPTLQTPAGYNGQKALLFGAGSANGTLIAPGGIPTNSDYSFVFVGHAPHFSGLQYIWSDLRETGYTGWSINGASGDKLNGIHSGSTVLQPTGPNVSVTSPNLILWSYKMTGKIGKFRLNGTEVQTGRTDALEVTEGTLQVGMQGGPAPLAHGPWTNGYMAELIMFNIPLSDVSNATLLANLESYLRARYAV